MTTAHPEYAIDGFAHDVTSFLLKPIDFDRFLKVAVKLRTVWEQKILLSEKNNSNSPVSPGLSQDEGYIWIKAHKKLLCRRFKEIYAIEGCGDYVKIYCADEVITSRCALGYILEKLPASLFVKTHRSYIVNRQAIKQIDGKMITTLNDIRLPITSKSEHHEIIQQIIS
jgi:two-component system LytT family response regulator